MKQPGEGGGGGGGGLHVSGRGGWDLSEYGVSGPRPLSFSGSCFPSPELSLTYCPTGSPPLARHAGSFLCYHLSPRRDKLSHKHSLGVPADYELKQTLPPS